MTFYTGGAHFVFHHYFFVAAGLLSPIPCLIHVLLLFDRHVSFYLTELLIVLSLKQNKLI